MDSDSEMEVAILEARTKTDPVISRWLRTQGSTMKMHDEYIENTLFSHMDSCMYWGREEDTPPETEISRHKHQRCVNEYGMSAIQRLFRTLVGFHIGILDGVGRYPSRYARARTRLDAFVDDLKYATRGCSSIQGQDAVTEDGVQGIAVCLLEANKLWEDLARKWHLGRTVDCDFIMAEFEAWEKVVEKYPRPQFQILLLLDLPLEILAHIMSVSSMVQRRRWHMTCKALQEQASQFIYEDVDYEMRVDDLDLPILDDIPLDAEEHGRRVRAHVHEVAFAQRDAIYERMCRATRTRDIWRQIRCLTFLECWSSEWAAFYPFNFVDDMDIPYLELVGSFYELLYIQLLLSPVVRFSFYSRYINETLWEGIAWCKTLRTLHLDTIVPADVQWAPSIVNLHLKMEHLRHDDNWLLNLACFCPSVLFLSFYGHQGHGAPLLPRIIDDRGHNIMTHIRRLDLRRVRAESLTILADAITAAGIAPLTHLSILPIASHIKRDVALALCDSFLHAPHLRVLRIAGLQYARPEFLAALGHSAPDLTKLVLEFCASVSYKQLPLTPWPRPCFEYAPHLAALPHLEHLGLNMPLSAMRLATCSLLHMERAEDAASGVPAFSANRQDDEIEVDAAKATARLFAVHGRSLKTIFFEEVEKAFWMTAWAVDRDIDGRPLVRDRLTHSESMEGREFMYCENWDFDEREGREIVRGKV
ncbi:uncharacterized protein SCHCODRAFT_02752734 [Schizophyllum commune H4-8]|uniref:uncharacterized protein n=1 Tax=Schizophyllum commune (strain H4-8 / FGSC 9210) TaxID=578458 RepID=UPI00215E4056|nr:uncharacterized protein SCHCODRAFT_02752734 [Schizophyllum commune H4-8]KAI5887254.1 hypothetical protein SCHCODRAFT_02752734 [Schizophyllum commune H4-8]